MLSSCYGREHFLDSCYSCYRVMLHAWALLLLALLLGLLALLLLWVATLKA